MTAIKQVLAEHPFLKGLTEEQFVTIAGCAYDATFESGEFIFREGQEANSFYILTHGRVALEVFTPGRGPINIETLSEGEVLGWSWMFPPYHWHFDARSLELTRAIAFDGRCLRIKCEDDHELGYQLVMRFANVMAGRLQATRMQLIDVYGVRK